MIEKKRNPLIDFVKDVNLSFKREQLLYDIKNYAFVEGDVMQAKTEHDRHQVIDVGEDGNIDRVTRVLDLSFVECVDLLYPYSKKTFEDMQDSNDILEETETYTIEMKVPDWFSKTTVVLLEKLIHEYMVYRVLADWMSITNPASKANWEEKIEDVSEKIRGCMNARCRRLRRTQTPF